MIKHIYAERKFSVISASQQSSLRLQSSGISQGCPLSPFLFVMLMTVVVHDATASLSPELKEAVAQGKLNTVLYADDTLIVGVEESHLQGMLTAISETGARYGMSLHWSKFQRASSEFQSSSPFFKVLSAKVSG